MNFDNWEYKEAELPKDPQLKEAFIQNLKEKFLKEVQANEAVQVWLQRFSDLSSEHFLKYYAGYKAQLVQHSDYYIQQAERVPELQHREKTQQVFGMMLQKKLFNLQCRWRAEEITLPGVRVCTDFWYWAENIFHCPFLDPITDTELEMIQRYIQTDDFDPEYILGNAYSWQRYDAIQRHRKESTFDEEVMPWYECCDTYMGTSRLLLLPDIRGQKEQVYLNAYWQKIKEEQAATNADKQPVEQELPKKWLSYSVHRCYQLARVYDDPHFVALMKADSEEEATSDALEGEECDPEHYMFLLRNIPNLPPVRPGVSWRMALKYCYTDYLREAIAQELPAVCEEYQLYRNMGLQYAPEKEDNEDEKNLEDYTLSNIRIQHLLQGRALLGEPEDLNF